MLRSERGLIAFAFARKPGFLFGVFVSLFGMLFLATMLRAAQVTQVFSVILARPIIATSTTILFSFKPSSNLASGSFIAFEIAPAFGVPASVTSADGSLSVNSVSKTLGASAGNGVYGYAISGHTITLTIASNETLPAGATVEFLVGRELGVITPVGYVTSIFNARFYDPLSQLLGVSQGATLLYPPIGVTASSTATNPVIRILNLRPELTSTSLGAQYLTSFFVTVKYSIVGGGGGGTTNNPTVYRDTDTHQGDANGNSASPITLTGASDGNYDVSIKTNQHLSRALREAYLVGATTTDLDYSTSTLVLLGGDISGDGNSVFTYGDDVANAVDISLITEALDGLDADGVTVRANLNHDSEVNSVDLSILLKNLDMEGDLRN